MTERKRDDGGDGAAEARIARLPDDDEAARDPGNAAWQRDLIVSNVKTAEAGGDARRSCTRALKVAEAMAEKSIFVPADAWMVEDLRKRLAEAG